MILYYFVFVWIALTVENTDNIVMKIRIDVATWLQDIIL